jgi:RNA polymerase sigma-70 factor (ECF subfamily)
MADFPKTRNSLLAQVQNLSDDESWREFVTIYRPVVYRFARGRGLQHADAEDLAQKVILSVRKSIGNWKFDPARGRFRSWLAKIAQNAIINALGRQPPDAARGGTSILELIENHPEPDHENQEQLHREHCRSLFRWAAERIREEFHEGVWNAFWLTAVEGTSVEETSKRLKKSQGAIYAARSRVMRRLKAEIEKSGFVHGESDE